MFKYAILSVLLVQSAQADLWKRDPRAQEVLPTPTAEPPAQVPTDALFASAEVFSSVFDQITSTATSDQAAIATQEPYSGPMDNGAPGEYGEYVPTNPFPETLESSVVLEPQQPIEDVIFGELKGKKQSTRSGSWSTVKVSALPVYPTPVATSKPKPVYSSVVGKPLTLVKNLADLKGAKPTAKPGKPSKPVKTPMFSSVVGEPLTLSANMVELKKVKPTAKPTAKPSKSVYSSVVGEALMITPTATAGWISLVKRQEGELFGLAKGKSSAAPTSTAVSLVSSSIADSLSITSEVVAQETESVVFSSAVDEALTLTGLSVDATPVVEEPAASPVEEPVSEEPSVIPTEEPVPEETTAPAEEPVSEESAVPTPSESPVEEPVETDATVTVTVTEHHEATPVTVTEYVTVVPTSEPVYSSVVEEPLALTTQEAVPEETPVYSSVADAPLTLTTEVPDAVPEETPVISSVSEDTQPEETASVFSSVIDAPLSIIFTSTAKPTLAVSSTAKPTVAVSSTRIVAVSPKASPSAARTSTISA